MSSSRRQESGAAAAAALASAAAAGLSVSHSHWARSNAARKGREARQGAMALGASSAATTRPGCCCEAWSGVSVVQTRPRSPVVRRAARPPGAFHRHHLPLCSLDSICNSPALLRACRHQVCLFTLRPSQRGAEPLLSARPLDPRLRPLSNLGAAWPAAWLLSRVRLCAAAWWPAHAPCSCRRGAPLPAPSAGAPCTVVRNVGVYSRSNHIEATIPLTVPSI